MSRVVSAGRTTTVVAVGIFALVGGFTAMSAVAFSGVGENQLAPAATVPPNYPTNQSGDTYGSAGQATGPDSEPDLIAVIASDGVEGFVRKSELDDANGTTALQSFTSPEDAIKWQQSAGAADRTVPVYSVDGKTVVGEFLIVGYDSQVRMQQEYGAELLEGFGGR